MTCVYFIVVRVAEAILSSRRGDTLAVHHGLVPVAESVKSAALNPELFEEGIEVSLPTQVRIPRRAFAVAKSRLSRFGRLTSLSYFVYTIYLTHRRICEIASRIAVSLLQRHLHIQVVGYEGPGVGGFVD
jgi:hypothetical protein